MPQADPDSIVGVCGHCLGWEQVVVCPPSLEAAARERFPALVVMVSPYAPAGRDVYLVACPDCALWP